MRRANRDRSSGIASVEEVEGWMGNSGADVLCYVEAGGRKEETQQKGHMKISYTGGCWRRNRNRL